MSNLSNYPPGVTGFELQIAGADYEIEKVKQCFSCDSEVLQIIEGYHGREWFTCEVCGSFNEYEIEREDYE